MTEMLQSVLEAKYASRLAEFQVILRRENSLRQSLDMLRQRSRATQAATTSDMKTIGADVIWQSWIERKTRELNMELAQVLVQKEQGLYLLRKDFGRKQAGSEVRNQLSNARTKHRAKQRDARILAQIVQDMKDT